jgi:hypothetical protein
LLRSSAFILLGRVIVRSRSSSSSGGKIIHGSIAVEIAVKAIGYYSIF